MSGPEEGSRYDPYDLWGSDGDDLCDSSSESDLLEDNPDASSEQPVKRLILPLEELCCRFVGRNLPFGTVQLYPSRVPEDLQRRIAFWSFPTEEEELLTRAMQMGGATELEVQSARRSKVESMLQSGMYLTGTILPSPITYRYKNVSMKRKGESFRPYVQFDRGCITTTKCSCSKRSWCSHVLALCLARINEGAPVQLYPPISETLRDFDRDQLQKLVQYFLDELPLNVAPLQSIASRLQDKDSEINSTPGAPDLTAGGCPGDKPAWQVDKTAILRRLESAYKRMMGLELCSGLQSHKDKLLGFKDFSSASTPNATSVLHSLLLDENGDYLSIALSWAVQKLDEESEESHFSELKHWSEMKKWVEWCFCRMLLPVMGMFFISPAVGSRAKQDATKSINKCLITYPSGPIYDLLHCFRQIGANGLLADPVGRHQLLAHLRKSVSRNLPQHTAKDARIGEPTCTSSGLLHSAMAVVQYMKFHDCTSEAEMENIVSTICAFLFPAILADVESQEELVNIRPEFKQIQLPLLLEYGISLLQSSTTPDSATKLVFQLMGSHLPLQRCHTDVMVYRNWAESVIIAHVDEAETFTKASPGVQSKLSELSIKWLTQTCLALEGDPNPIATLTGMWGMMRLVCRFRTDDCMKAVKQMTQKLIGMISSTLSTPREDNSARNNRNLLNDVMGCSFCDLLVDLFTMLPTGDCQKLFTTLYKVYPRPLNAKKAKDIRKRSPFGHYPLGRASTPSKRCQYSFFPRQPSVADFEHQLLDANRFCTDADTPSDAKRAKLSPVCCNMCSVSTGHIRFVEKLHKCLQDRNAPLQFEMQLLISLVSNCVHYDWLNSSPIRNIHSSRGRSHDLLSGDHIHENHSLCDSLLSSNDLGFSLEVLREMWRFSIEPQTTLELLEAVQGRACPQFRDVMCDILVAVRECEASLHWRISELMLKINIATKPEHKVLQQP